MPTPANRTPLRVARGTYSNLNTSVADIQEGEICYATDEDKLYVKEGGSLVSTQADTSSFLDSGDVGVTVQAYDTDNAVTDAAQTFTAPQRGSITTLTISASAITIDFSQSNNFYLDLNAGVTTVNVSSATAGQSGSIFLDLDGSSTIAGWDAAIKWGTAGAPTVTADATKMDRIDYVIYDASNIHFVWTGGY